MDIKKAYDFTIQSIENLHGLGIEVNFEFVNLAKNKELAEEYKNKEGRLSAEYWRHISFKPKNKFEYYQISKLQDYLNSLGMYFDTGGSVYDYGDRDWELDWSFHINKELV